MWCYGSLDINKKISLRLVLEQWKYKPKIQLAINRFFQLPGRAKQKKFKNWKSSSEFTNFQQFFLGSTIDIHVKMVAYDYLQWSRKR